MQAPRAGHPTWGAWGPSRDISPGSAGEDGAQLLLLPSSTIWFAAPWPPATADGESALSLRQHNLCKLERLFLKHPGLCPNPSEKAGERGTETSPLPSAAVAAGSRCRDEPVARRAARARARAPKSQRRSSSSHASACQSRDEFSSHLLLRGLARTTCALAAAGLGRVGDGALTPPNIPLPWTAGRARGQRCCSLTPAFNIWVHSVWSQPLSQHKIQLDTRPGSWTDTDAVRTRGLGEAGGHLLPTAAWTLLGSSCP